VTLFAPSLGAAISNFGVALDTCANTCSSRTKNKLS
jgi:hypothetical protein